jgi:hypothetical protein
MSFISPKRVNSIKKPLRQGLFILISQERRGAVHSFVETVALKYSLFKRAM